MGDVFSDPMMEEEAQRQDPRRRRRARRRTGFGPPGYGKGYYNPHRIARFSGMKGNRPPNTRQIQRMLKAKGYRIGKVDGIYGPRTKSAYNAYANGRGSERWNSRHRRARPAAPRPAGPSGGGGGGGGGGAPLDDGGFADQENFGGVPDADIGGTNTSRMLPRDMADELAGYEFDPQIQELLVQLKQGKRDTAQHQSDIGGWYGQVRGSMDTARQRDQEAGTRARTDVQNALSGILASLGGSRGAGVVGAAGLSDLTALAAQGATQDRYNADLAPLMAAEEAAAHTRETALGSQRKSAIDQALVRARGQRGQSEAKNLLGIIQSNNQGRQTNFQNRLAVQNARLAAASLGINADQAYAGIEAQRAATRQNEAKLKMQSLQQQEASGAPNWSRLNYPDRQTVVYDAVGRAAATMDPDHWDESYVRDRAYRILRSAGYSNAWGRVNKGRAKNKQTRRQIQSAVETAVRAAYQAWKAKQSE